MCGLRRVICRNRKQSGRFLTPFLFFYCSCFSHFYIFLSNSVGRFPLFRPAVSLIVVILHFLPDTHRILIPVSELTASSPLPPCVSLLPLSPSVAAFRVLSALLFLAGSQTALGARWQLLKALLNAAGGGVGEREERRKGRVGKGGKGGNGTRNVATRRVQLTSENFCCHGTQVPPPGGALLYCSSPH